MSKEERRKQKQEEIRRKIFIGGLSKLTNETKIEEVFSQFGELEDILINRDIKSHESKGCAFVLFKKEGVAQELINLKRRLIVDDHSIEIKKCYEKAKKPQLGLAENMEMFISQMIQFQQMFMGNQMSPYQRKSVNEAFCDTYRQFENQGMPNANLGYHGYGMQSRDLNSFDGLNRNAGQAKFHQSGFGGIQRPADFTFANHFQSVMNRERREEYSPEQFMNDFERCPVAKILIKKSKKGSKCDLRHRETFSKILETLADVNFKLDHDESNLRFNKQMLRTWAFLSQRMKIQSKTGCKF